MKLARRKSCVAISIPLLIIVSSLVWADNKKTNQAPAQKPAAAPKAAPARPAQAARPAQSAPARPAQMNTARPGQSNAARPGQANTTARPGMGNNTTSWPGMTNTANARPGMGNTGKPGQPGMAGSKPGSTTGAMARPGNRGSTNMQGHGQATNMQGHGQQTATGMRGGQPAAHNGPGNNMVNAHGREPGNTHLAANVDHRGPGAGGHAVREPVRNERMVGNHRVAFDERGRMRDIHSHGMEVHRDLRGERHFVVEHNGRRAVMMGRTRYVERPYFNRYGHSYYNRTYVVGGRSYAYVYRGYPYRGVTYYGYVPPYYYRPAYYGWAYNPWAAPVAYNWGWNATPWYPAYGYYFTPYQTYAAPSEWLADYMISQNLQAAYEARAQANAAAAVAASSSAPPQPMTPEVKRMVAEEVKRQIAEEREFAQRSPQASSAQAPAGNETPSALDPNHQVFVVANALDLAGESGECSVSPGDVLVRSDTNVDANNALPVQVMSSQRGDCPVSTHAQVQLSDLQEMHNHFRETLNTGLKTLASNQGKSGIPAAPDTGTTTSEVGEGTPDAGAQTELQQQEKSVDQVEAQVQKGGSGGGQ